MALALNDYTQLLDELPGTESDDSVPLDWAERFVEQMLDESRVQAHIAIAKISTRDTWNVEIEAFGQTVVLIDVIVAVDDATRLDDIDRSTAKAAAQWRRVTRVSRTGVVRPWIGVVALTNGPGSAVREILRELVASRTFDATCLLGDPVPNRLGDPLGLNPFAAALLGRLVYARTVIGDADKAKNLRHWP